MTTADIFGICGAVAAGMGLYGAIVNAPPIRKILAFNLLSSGVFLLFGAVARRGAVAPFNGDPVPQALVITGIVVAAAATALSVALLVKLVELSGTATLRSDSASSGDRVE